MKRLCPQEYTHCGVMRVTPCTSCHSGWDAKQGLCVIHTGAEDFDPVPLEEVPTCPIQSECQHQLQSGDRPCVVRASGQICESALIYSGLSMEEAQAHPLSFNADHL